MFIWRFGTILIKINIEFIIRIINKNITFLTTKIPFYLFWKSVFKFFWRQKQYPKKKPISTHAQVLKIGYANQKRKDDDHGQH